MTAQDKRQIYKTRLGASVRSAFAQDLLIAGFLLLVPTLFFWRVSFEGKALVTTGNWAFVQLDREWNPIIGDSTLQCYPAGVYADRMLKGGSIPLWNPYLFSGTPFLANGQVGVFYPINMLLWKVMPPARAFGYSAIFHFFLAGLFAYFFLRTRGVGRFGSLVAALTFMLNGYFVSVLFAPTIVYTLIWLPAILYFLERSLNRRSWVYGLAMGGCIGLSCLTGQITGTASVLFVAGCYSAARLVLVFASTRQAKAILPALGAAGIALVVGLGIGAIQLLPSYELVTLSHRWSSTTVPSFDLKGSLLALKEWLFTQMVPEFYGNHIDHNWQFDLAQRNMIGVATYIGILPLILAAFACCFRRDRQTILFSCWAGLALLDKIGVPIVSLVTLVLPGQVRGSLFHWGSAVFFIFPLTLLAGLGADHLSRELKRSDSPKIRASLKALGVAGGIGFLGVSAIHFLAKYSKREFSIFYPFQVSDFRAGYQLDSVMVFLFFLVCSTALIGLAYKKRVKTGFFQVLAVTLVLADLFFFGMDFNPAIDPDAADGWRWPEVDILQEDTSIFRILPQAGWYWNNYGAMLFEQQTLLGYDSLYLRRYQRFLQSSGIADVTQHQHHPQLRDPTNRLLDLLNVKYLVDIDESYQSPSIIDLVEALPTAAIQSRYVTPMPITLQGVTREVIAMEPGEIRYQAMTVSAESVLHFGIGMAEWSWDGLHQTDGVQFEVYVEDKTGKQTVFSKSLDPTNKPDERGWADQMVNLSPYRGQTIDLGFVIRPGATTKSDMALWAEPRIVTDWTSSGRFSLVFSREVSNGQSWHTWNTYQNQTCLPRAFVVHDFEVIENEEALLQELTGGDFDPRNIVLLEEYPHEIKGEILPPTQSDEGEKVEIISYTPHEVALQTETGEDGFLILADSFYPGWNAYVDGKETKVYVADYILRSVYLEAGRHFVKFVFDPPSFKWGGRISSATLLAAGGLLLILGVRNWKRKGRHLLTEGSETDQP